MIGDNMGVIELGLVFGGALLLLAYQYWATARSIRRDKDGSDKLRASRSKKSVRPE